MSRRNHQQIQDSSEEAEEVQEHVELEAPSEHPSEEEGEDLLEDAERDYQKIEALDQYEEEGIDDEEYQVNPEARRAAEKELRWKERYEEGQEADVEFYMEDIEQKQAKRKRAQYYATMTEDYDQDNDQECIDAEEQKGKFENWINLEAVRAYIRHHMCKFFTRFSVNNTLVYYPLIKEMVLENKQSLKLDFQHLRSANDKLALWLARHPISFIPELNSALYSITCNIFPNYKLQHSECFVRVFNLPVVDNIRQLTHSNLGQLVRFYGVVTARSDVYNQLLKVVFKCYVCGTSKGPFFINNNGKPILGRCLSCQSSGPFLLEKSKSIYRNYQTLTIQQSPSQVDPGRIPRSKQAILLGDIIDTVKPGAEVEVVGVFSTRYECSLNVKQGFPVFSTFIQVNSINLVDEINSFAKIDQRSFQQFAKRPDFAARFFKSIAPSVYGHYRVKRSLAMAMFGGVAKNRDGHKTRGDINVLLLGDPGVAKSQFLKSVQKVFYRCIYTTGKGASAVGLTASVKQDPQNGQWRLQAGALVMADKGICLIDQFDKMSEADRTSIHEAMEQQTISISKAGIVANLNARCSVIAAANPYGGCYNQTLNFADNVQLSAPILSRFDILNVIKDKHNVELDSSLSDFVINVHMQNHPYNSQYKTESQEKVGKKSPKEDQNQQLEFLKQYIKYARERYAPTLSNACANLIHKFYGELRTHSLQRGGINIAPRHLESMIRICEGNDEIYLAHARMHLRAQTKICDADFAVDMMLQSFIDTQKHSSAEEIKKKFAKYLLKEEC